MLLTPAEPLLLALLLALAVDGLIGDPAWLYRRLPHPVVLMGRAIERLEARWLDGAASAAVQRRLGRRSSLPVILASAGVGAVLQWVCLTLPLGWLWLGLLMSILVAFRGLRQHVAAVADGLDQSLVAGRSAVARIVGRDPESLDRPAVARAAIESTAENFADGVVAPVLYAALLGLPGMLVYKAINTLDSMIGHRTARHEHFGRFAAKLDDVVNWIPARLGALLILAAGALLPNAEPASGWRAMWRDAAQHRSPNAGWPEAAMAGCLGLRLAGPRSYGGAAVDDGWMGDGRAEATPADIRSALGVLTRATMALALLVVFGLGAVAWAG
jgi:adenosylcobinamide-phosphate synthase